MLASARTVAIRRAACPFPGLFKLVVEMAAGDLSASVTRCVFVHAERNCGAVFDGFRAAADRSSDRAVSSWVPPFIILESEHQPEAGQPDHA